MRRTCGPRRSGPPRARRRRARRRRSRRRSRGPRTAGAPGRRGRCTRYRSQCSLLVPLEPVERLEHAEVGGGHHRRRSLASGCSPILSARRARELRGLWMHRSTGRDRRRRGSSPPTGPRWAIRRSGLGPDDLRAPLRWMILARRLDRECIALQRQGELTVYPGFEGQEAAQIGSAMALGAEDFIFPTFRELAVALVRGVDPVRYLWYHRGTWHGGPYDPRATRFGPICIPIATQIAHAAGYALGQQLDGVGRDHGRVLRRRRDERGRLPRGREPRGGAAPAARAVLPEQRVGDQRARRASQTAGRDLAARRGVRVPRRPGRRQRRARRVRGHARRRRARPRRRGPDPDRGATYRIGAHSTADDATRYRDDGGGRAARARSTRSRGSARGCGRRATPTTTLVAAYEAEADDVRARGPRGAGRPGRRRRRSGRSTGSTPTRPRRSCASARRRSGG